MQELEEILKAHAARYPLMEPTDAVKLIFQNEFGGGHLIRDTQSCLTYLRREYAAVETCSALPLLEDIGNGLVRVNLAAVSEDTYPLDRLGRDFIRSANAHKGSPERFRAKLAVLERLTAEGIFQFTPQELASYLAEYEKAGYPPVSHSPEYRAAYHPAYRVVMKAEIMG